MTELTVPPSVDPEEVESLVREEVESLVRDFLAGDEVEIRGDEMIDERLNSLCRRYERLI